MPERRSLSFLQGGRAAAAIAVALSHTQIALAAFGEGLPSNLSSIMARGVNGVDFFFVLSGFIITYAHGGDNKSLPKAKRFAVGRLARIYIPYLPISIALLAIYIIAPGISHAPRDWSILTSMTLLPSSASPALSVAWTLVHEVVFYGIFLLSYFVEDGLLPILFTWAVVIICLWYLGWNLPERASVLGALLAPINLEFLAGAVAAYLSSKISAMLWPLILSLGMIICVVFMFIDAPNRFLVCTGMFMLVLGLVLFELKTGIRAPKWVTFLGAASYSIYLVHDPVISIVIRITQRQDSWVIGLAACLLSSIFCGVVYHIVLERPLLMRARKVLLPTASDERLRS